VIDILNLDCGNVLTWVNLLNKLNISSNLVSKEIHLSNHTLVIPGVGSAKYFMDSLLKNSFDKIIYQHLSNGNRIIGICVGFQMLNKYSEEDGGVKGLGLIDGNVKRYYNNGYKNNNGWLKFEFDKRLIKSHKINQLKLSKKVILRGRVYYNHQYAVILNKNTHAGNYCIPDTNYSSIYVNDNIIGIQFHPEKSQNMGIDLLKVIL